jgi:hypothetical protein
MRLEDNKLDDLLREKLKNFAPEPPSDLWNRISKEMDRKKAARRMIIYRWMGAAAVLLLAMVTGILVTLNDSTLPVKDISKQISTIPEKSPENTPVQNSKEINRNTVEINGNKLFKAEAQKNAHKINNTATDSVFPVGIEKQERVNFLAVISGKTTRHQPLEILRSSLADYTIIVRRDFITPSVFKSPFDEQKMFAMETVHSSKKDKTALEWKVGVQLAPAYSSHASGYTSNYSRAMITSGKPSQTAMGGGVSIQAKTSRRWTIESGLYYSRSGDKSSSGGQLFAANADYSSLAGGNKYYSNATVLKDGQMIMNSTAGVIRLSQTPDNAKFISGAESAIGMNSVLLMSGDFFQVFDFMEMPLTARYRLIDGKIDLELLSGLSANFVVGNQVVMEYGSIRENVGKTEDISRLGFSGVAGFGVIYPLSKRISITIEPRASYWLSSLNNSSEVDFRPWRIGIYSGVTFGF